MLVTLLREGATGGSFHEAMVSVVWFAALFTPLIVAGRK